MVVEWWWLRGGSIVDGGGVWCMVGVSLCGRGGGVVYVWCCGVGDPLVW